MKLQRNTVILLVVALGLGGVVLISESQRSPDTADTLEQDQGDRLFDFEEADVQTLTVDADNGTLRFERDGAGEWQMTEPENTQAEPAAIAFLLNLLRTESARETLNITSAEQADFGFDPPAATVEFALADGTTHTLTLGTTAFSGDAVYGLIDAEAVPLPEDAGEIAVQVVPIDFVNAVNRPVEEWQVAIAPATPDASTPAAGSSSESQSKAAESPDPPNLEASPSTPPEAAPPSNSQN
ncbi:MAG: DUF4340 domain-containing protein [Leptolyngbyaceae cyanobacterium SM1_1_3]|nr:DUF4340 domain-containing protein [Leptolyngbyaceae cyanobacterium SM1_1_3]NJN01515.1 DUF4340 domain-containing protein [Leptolyngbyaceae cyanobacterium RM1_1_2]NJO08679.1 DUF4340 domain-containing protein [Leptolyngbyaceae cyanobacterium SL_1_1]